MHYCLGYYMTLMPYSGASKSGPSGYLLSPFMEPNERPQCISFYYWMDGRIIDPSGPTIGALYVYYAHKKRRYMLWRLLNQLEDRWLPARTPVAVDSKGNFPEDSYQVTLLN